VAFADGASYDPTARCVTPFDLGEHWAQLDRGRGKQQQEHAIQPPAAAEVQPDLIIVPRAQIDPDHQRRIATLTSKAHFCRHKAAVATSRAQRPWARQEADRLFEQLRSLRAEQVAVPPEPAYRGPLPASRATTPGSRSARSPALAVIQGELFSHTPAAGKSGRAPP
jgi:hypothetical protein